MNRVSTHAELTFLSKQAAGINCTLSLTSPNGLYLNVKQKVRLTINIKVASCFTNRSVKISSLHRVTQYSEQDFTA